MFHQTHQYSNEPMAETDLSIAKRYLQKFRYDDRSIWDILNEAFLIARNFPEKLNEREFLKILKGVLVERNYHNGIREFYTRTAPYSEALSNCQLFKSLKYKFHSISRIADPNNAPDPLTLKKMQLLNDAGVGLTQAESFTLMMSMRRLCEETKVSKARVWGKILGLQKNYYIIEVNPSQEEIKAAIVRSKIMTDKDKAAEVVKKYNNVVTNTIDSIDGLLRDMKEEVVSIKEGIVVALTEKRDVKEDEAKPEGPIDPIAAQQLLVKYIMPPIPLPPVFKEVIVPSEPLGEGINEKRYYVSNDPSGDFELLPETTPAHIVTARCITRYLTGNLDTPIISFPEFPGTEREYLRAQLTRISAGTMVCPEGVYVIPSGEEEIIAEEDLLPGGIIENKDYHAQPIKNLVDSQKNHWIHFRQYILRQGRVTYWKPKSPDTGEMEFLMDEWDEDELRGRTKPPILTSISRDDSPEVDVCWSVRRSHRTLGNNMCILVRSNVWPGAVAVSRGYLWENVYIGWGVKYLCNSYSPSPMPQPWDEFEIHPGITEKTDPTPVEEEIWREKHRPPPVPGADTHKGEGGEDALEDENEDDDDE